MEQLVIEGGRPLVGEVEISGAKNAALPLLAASLLADRPVVLKRVPHLRDVSTMLTVLAHEGAEVAFDDEGLVHIDATRVHRPEAPYAIVKTMRASALVLGPLVGRFGRARVGLPGGCAIGARPMDLHLKGLEAMGATVRIEQGDIVAEAPKGLSGTHFVFDRVTVTGTENLMMAAVFARGTTVLENAAREPEVVNLAETLNAWGAKIRGAGSDRIEIEGVGALSGGEATVIPDRIEAGTYLAAGLITGGEVCARACIPQHLDAFLARVREAGAVVEEGEDWVRVRAPERLRAVSIRTQPYPGFPTDLQAQFMAMMTLARGSSVIRETIFENRFMHVPELMRMGAQIEIDGDTAIVHGVERLTGAPVMASDLRASASLVLAGLAAEGTTVVQRIYHIDRGYERIEEKLARLGARIRREGGAEAWRMAASL